jgi:hypothetical protein
MKAGLGVGLTMVAISLAVAACEHEAQRDTSANAARPYFESADRAANTAEPSPAVQRTSTAVDQDEAASRAGHTDRFLWDDRAAMPDAGADGGVDL